MLRRSPALERAPLGLVSPLPLLRKSSVARGKKAAALSFSASQGLPVPLPLDCCSKITSSDLVFSRDCFIWERVSLSFVRQSVCAAGFGMWSLHQVHAELDRELVGQLWNSVFNFLGCGSFGIGDPLHGPASRLASADHDLDPEGGLGQLGKAAGAAFLASNFVDVAALMSRGVMIDRNAADPCINKAVDCSFKMAEFSPYPAIISTGRGKGGVGGKKSTAVVRRSCRLLIKGSGQAATRAAKMKAARYDGNLGQSDPPPTIEDEKVEKGADVGVARMLAGGRGGRGGGGGGGGRSGRSPVTRAGGGGAAARGKYSGRRSAACSSYGGHGFGISAVVAVAFALANLM
ncbi:hypothetical protein Cni_G11019 [Canna indica]|uniref:Uncharacterized protein n=1 Tax=Canna indica TaxID=4628 RepID=A0AAQ3K789_9LILI|nr:hypothetical protein Cni_G11019 [Canna indica]